MKILSVKVTDCLSQEVPSSMSPIPPHLPGKAHSGMCVGVAGQGLALVGVGIFWVVAGLGDGC